MGNLGLTACKVERGDPPGMAKVKGCVEPNAECMNPLEAPGAHRYAAETRYFGHDSYINKIPINF